MVSEVQSEEFICGFGGRDGLIIHKLLNDWPLDEAGVAG